MLIGNLAGASLEYASANHTNNAHALFTIIASV